MSISNSGKISVSSAIFISMTSMIGAGIFIKAKTLNSLAHNFFSPIFFLFLIFLVNICAFVYVLIKIIPSQTGNMGFMEWSKNYCSKRIHQVSSNFIRFFYHPLSLVIFSVYGVMGLMGLVGRSNYGILSTLFFAFIVSGIFMFISFISFKWAHRIQLFLWILVLIPLFLLPLIGLFGGSSQASNEIQNDNKATGLDSLGPWMILISGLPSILFIYDGFYNLASLKSRLSSNKTLSFSLIISFVLVTILYLYVIIGFSVGDSNNSDYRNFAIFKSKPVLKEFFEVLVSCASFLTINSIVMSNISQLTAMDDAHGFEDVKFLKKRIFYKPNEDEIFESRFFMFVYLMFKTFVWFLIVAIASFIVSFATENKGLLDILDSLADIVSVFVFAILVSIILGSIKKSSHLKKSIFFRRCSFASSSLIIVALSYLFVSYLVGVTGYGGADKVSSWIKLFFLCIFVIGTQKEYIFDMFNKIFRKKQHVLYLDRNSGSIASFN